MPGGFTWADVLAGFQAGGQAAISTAGLAVGIVVFVFCLGLIVFGLCASAGQADRAIDRMRADRADQGGAVRDFDDIDWDFPETTDLTHRRAS